MVSRGLFKWQEFNVKGGWMLVLLCKVFLDSYFDQLDSESGLGNLTWTVLVVLFVFALYRTITRRKKSQHGGGVSSIPKHVHPKIT